MYDIILEYVLNLSVSMSIVLTYLGDCYFTFKWK